MILFSCKGLRKYLNIFSDYCQKWRGVGAGPLIGWLFFDYVKQKITIWSDYRVSVDKYRLPMLENERKSSGVYLKKPDRMFDLCYHTISKGNNGSAIFLDDEDRQKYYDLMLEVKNGGGMSVHNYTLLGTHLHHKSSFESKIAYGEAIKFINEKYALYFRKKYGGSGHVFRNRPKRYEIDNERYMITCGIYIELNPVRAGIVSGPTEYRWSSHRFYVLGEKDPLVELNPSFLSLGASVEEARKTYIKLTKMWLERPVTKKEARKQG